MNETKFETGTSSFLDRYALARRFEENLEALIDDAGFYILPYGNVTVVQDNTWITSKLKRVESKASEAAIRVKFTPDYIIVKKDNPDVFFYADAKVSITPVFFQKQIDRIKQNYHEGDRLSRNDIGEIEREAWYSYNKFYPNGMMAIIIACPYNPNLVLAEWVNNIDCMWCLKGKIDGVSVPWDCNSCPVFNRDGSFGVLVNEFAGGSGTPHTNINLGTMRTLETFLSDEFNVRINNELYNEGILEFIKKWPLNKPRGSVNWGQYNGTIRLLKAKCPWLKCRIKDEFIPCPGEEEATLF